jgi:hypothetical protein
LRRSTRRLERAPRISSFPKSFTAELVNLSVFRSCRFDQTVSDATSVSSVATTIRVQTTAERRLVVSLAFFGAIGQDSPRPG